MTSSGTDGYTWDARNRLVSISGGVTASFQYDPLGRRTRKTISGTTTDFLYDGLNPIEELASGSPLANLLTGLGVDEYFSRTDTLGTHTLLTDALGSTLALTDSAGSVLAQYTYEPFGNTTAIGSAFSPYQYTGRENDGTGLYFYRARYYKPTLQRFISEDPIGFGGGDTNLYAYVWNSPTNFFDPVGQFGWPVHVRITNNALQAAGLSPDPGMAQQVAAVDFREGSQGTDANATNTHAMAGRKPNGKSQNCQQASQGTQEQIIDDVNSGDLTKALHTIQDAYSPSHYPFQFWGGGYGPLHIPSPGHMYGDFFPPQSAIDAATAASAQFLKDILDNPNDPMDPRRYLPVNPCRGSH